MEPEQSHSRTPSRHGTRASRRGTFQQPEVRRSSSSLQQPEVRRSSSSVVTAAAAGDAPPPARRHSSLTLEVESGASATSDDELDDDPNDPSTVNGFVKELKQQRKHKGLQILLDKLLFCLGLLNVVVLAVCAFDYDLHMILPYFYSIKFVLLLSWRFITYFQRKWHLFMLDFCYFTNTAVCVYLWLAPHSPELFYVLFALSHGPLAFAVVAFRNSLVLHSIDKITSCFIHVSPPLLMYVLRWYPEKTASWWYTSFATCLHPAPSDDASIGVAGESGCERDFGLQTWTWTLFVPFAAFVGHSVLYFFLVQLMPCTAHVRRDKRYLTSFRFLAASKGGLLYRFINAFGRNGRIPMYAVFNYFFCLFTCVWAAFWINSQIAGGLFLGAIAGIATFNGANFYFEVFSRKYHAPKKGGR